MAELEVVIDGRPARRGADVVIRSLDDITKRTRRTERGLNRTSRAMNKTARAGSQLGGALKGVAALLVARQIVKYADAWTNLQNRLRLVTTGTDNLSRVTEELFQIAQRSRIGLGETADLYSRIARSSQELGLSQNELLGITESVNQAITISGSSADSANAAIIQLGQGLASGALRGDELRSVLEQTPRLARAIADGLEVPIGALRTLGAEGELTAEKVIAAIQSQAAVLEEEFGQTVPTIAQGFTILENAITRAIGKFSDSTGAAGGFAGILIDLSKFIEEDFTPAFLEFGDIMAVTFQEAGRISDDFSSQFALLGVDTDEVLGFIGDSLVELPLNLLRAFEIVTTELGGFFASTLNEVDLFTNAAKGIFAGLSGDEDLQNEAIQERLQLLDDERNITLGLSAARDEVFANITRQENQLKAAIEERAAATARANAQDLDKKGNDGGGAVGGPNPKQLRDAEKLYAKLRTPQQEFEDTLAEIEALRISGALAGDKYNTVIQQLAIEYSAGLPEVKAYNDELKENAKIIEDLKSPTEVFAEKVAKLDMLADSGQLSWSNYARGVQEARAELEETDPLLVAQNERLEKAKDLLEEVATPQEEFNTKMAELRDLLANEALSPEQFARLSTAAQDAFEEATIAADPFLKKMESLAQSAAQNIEGAFVDFLVNPSEDAFDQMLNSWINTLQRMAAEALAAQLFQSLFGGAGAGAAGGGGLGGLFSAGLGAVFAAEGGTFPAGQPVLVGEEGPELIVPGQRSTVIPNDQSMAMMGGQAAPNVTVPVTIQNITDPSEIASALNSSQGQSAIVNAISQNPDAVRRALN